MQNLQVKNEFNEILIHVFKSYVNNEIQSHGFLLLFTIYVIIFYFSNFLKQEKPILFTG